MQMHYFPILLRFVQDDRPSIEEPDSIVEMESRHSHISEELYPQFLWLNVHVGRGRFAPAYLLKYRQERFLEFSTPVGPLRGCTGIKHCRIVIERQPKVFPI